MSKLEVPNSLRIWFFIHFIVDMIFAIPLIFFPYKFLSFFQWMVIDTFSARLVGAALFAIGSVSFLKINEGIESYRSLLLLKILWSSATLVAILLSMLENAAQFGWIIFIIFLMFFILWNYYLIKLKN